MAPFQKPKQQPEAESGHEEPEARAKVSRATSRSAQLTAAAQLSSDKPKKEQLAAESGDDDKSPR